MLKKKGYVLINRREGQGFVVYPVGRKNDSVAKVKLVYVDEYCGDAKIVLSLSGEYKVFNEQQDGSRKEVKPQKTVGKNKRGVAILRKEGERLFLIHECNEIEVLLDFIREYHDDGERAGWARFAVRSSTMSYTILREELLNRVHSHHNKKPSKRFKNLDELLESIHV